MARVHYETFASQPEDIPAGKHCWAGDALERSPAGALAVVRSAVIGMDAAGLAATNLRDEARVWFQGTECAELKRRAALTGSTILLGIRARFDPNNPRSRELARMHRILLYGA